MSDYTTFSKDATEGCVWLYPDEYEDPVYNIELPKCAGKYLICRDYIGLPHVSEMWVDLTHLDDYIEVYKADRGMKVHPLVYNIIHGPNSNVFPQGNTLALVKYTVFASEELFLEYMNFWLKKYYEAHI